MQSAIDKTVAYTDFKRAHCAVRFPVATKPFNDKPVGAIRQVGISDRIVKYPIPFRVESFEPITHAYFVRRLIVDGCYAQRKRILIRSKKKTVELRDALFQRRGVVVYTDTLVVEHEVRQHNGKGPVVGFQLRRSERYESIVATGINTAL